MASKNKSSLVKWAVVGVPIAMKVIDAGPTIESWYSYYKPLGEAACEVVQKIAAVEWQPAPLQDLPRDEKYHREPLILGSSTNTNTTTTPSPSCSGLA